MKKLYLIFSLFVFISTSAFAQFDDLLKKVTPSVGDFDPTKSISTSITDALPTCNWIVELESDEVSELNDWNLMPGYFRGSIQSYCLHAGKYGPYKGSGYLIAPLLGLRADIIKSILERSELYPNIPQTDIQQLLWSIEAGVKFSDLPNNLQISTKPLIDIKELAMLEVNPIAVTDLLPSGVKDALSFYSNFRGQLVSATTPFSDLERTAVKLGAPPIEPGDKEVTDGNWTYMKNGFFVRTFPERYAKTNIEIYRPLYINLQRDEKSRIILMNADGHSIEIVYDDEPGRDVLKTEGNSDLPIWRIKKITLKGAKPGEEEIIENSGWIVKGDGNPIKGSGAEKFIPYQREDDPTYGEYQDRVKKVNRHLKDFDEYKREAKLNDLKNQQADNWADFHTVEGLRVATNPLNKSGQMSWIKKTLKFTTDLWNSCSNALAGDEDNQPKKYNNPGSVSTPGNNGSQRLGLSNRWRNE